MKISTKGRYALRMMLEGDRRPSGYIQEVFGADRGGA